MTFLRLISSFVVALTCTAALAGAPTVGAPLPLLSIAERGELVMSGDDFKFVPWRSDAGLGNVNVVQYFAATQSDSEIFKPFTDLIGKSFAPGAVHITTVLNLDAAMWGTSGMVISELKKNKKIHPQATLVVDDKGVGVTEWALGQKGAGLMIVDDKGIVKYFTKQAMTDAELNAGVELVRSSMVH
jgi:YtfJ family uncharacterized protein